MVPQAEALDDGTQHLTDLRQDRGADAHVAGGGVHGGHPQPQHIRPVRRLLCLSRNTSVHHMAGIFYSRTWPSTDMTARMRCNLHTLAVLQGAGSLHVWCHE